MSDVMLRELPAFFISYDEPKAEEFWLENLQAYPNFKRIHGVKGFNSAYRGCAIAADSPRFITVDGDSRITFDFFEQGLSQNLFDSEYVFSWSCLNSINSLAYGNGGLKCWPRSAAINMKTHEAADSNLDSFDFFNTLKYFQLPAILTKCDVGQSPFQAFRAGFREGAKLSDYCSEWPEANRERVRIWCSVGLDAENGYWAMLGARLGTMKILDDNFNLGKLKNHDWIFEYWKDEILPLTEGQFFTPSLKIRELMETLKIKLNQSHSLNITTLNRESSIFFKSTYKNPHREGPQ